MSRLLRSTAGRAIAVVTAFALLCVGVVVGVTTISANAVETSGKYSGSGGSMKVTTATKQALQIECFSKIATKIKYLEPNVTRPVWAPKNITSTPDAFTPATSDAAPFMQVLGTKKTGSMGTVPADMINTGKTVSLYKFVLYFKTPVANPRLNLAGTEMTQMAGGVPQTSSGLSITFSDAKSWYWDKATPIVSTNRISGIDQVANSAYRIDGNTVLTDTVACDGNGGDCGTNPAERLAAVKAKIPGVDKLTTPLRGTVELNTNGVPVKKVTVTVGAIFYSAKDGAQTMPVPGFAIAPQFRSEVSAFQRTIGKYGHAMHAMPYVGNDNLRFGETIVEGNQHTYTTDLNSGQPDDNSDAGYDAPLKFYWEGDKSKTPVTSVTSKDKGKWLMLETKVSSARTDATAYVYGFIDWTGKGDFAKVDKGKSTLGCVSKGNGTVTIKWKVPATVTTGDINLRLRTAYDCCEIDKPTGPALSGEVEDWPGVFNRAKNNLKITKDVTSGKTAAPGDQVTYTITVKSLDSVATTSAVTVTDAVPAQLRDVTISTPATSGTASLSGRNLTWQLPAGLTRDQSVKVTGTVVDSTPAGEVANTAKLSGLCDPGNCEATSTFTVTKQASGELQLTNQIEAQTADPVKAGDRVRYVVTMAYNGTVPLNGFTFTNNMIPANDLWACTTPIPTTVNPGWTDTCRATYTVTEQDVTNSWDTGELVNTSRIAGTLSEAPGTELSKEASVPVAVDTKSARLDISGTTTVDLDAVVPDQTATFTITATNKGQVTANDVVILGAFDDATPTPIDPADCTWTAGAVGRLAPTATVTCTVEYTPTEADAGKTVTLKGSATATDAGTPYGPVSLGEAAVKVNAPSITIVKSNSLTGIPPVVSPDDTFFYTLTVKNSGTGPATNVRVSDQLPLGLVLDPATQAGWNVDPADSRHVTSDAFSLAVDETKELTLNVRVTDEQLGLITNIAAVEPLASIAVCKAEPTTPGCTADPNPPQIVGTPIRIRKVSDVEDGAPIQLGQEVTYTLTISNVSVQDATDVLVIDRLPDELEPYPTTQEGWTIDGQTLTADRFDLPAGTSKDLTILTRAAIATTDFVRNWTVVQDYNIVPVEVEQSGGLRRMAAASDTAAPTKKVEECISAKGGERCAYADIPAIQGRSSLSAQIYSTAPAAVKAGDRFEYMILVVNSGAAPATKVQLSHALPAGLEFDGKQDSFWRVDGRTASLSADVPARSAAAFWLNVKVSSGASGPLQAFTMFDGALLTDCQANWKAAGCAVDPSAPIAS